MIMKLKNQRPGPKWAVEPVKEREEEKRIGHFPVVSHSMIRWK
jgi:hypothetical protein